MAMTPPTFSSAIYDGASLLVVWQPAPNPGVSVTGYLVTVAGSDGSSLPTTFPGAGTTIGRVQTGALKTDVIYTVTVCVQSPGQPNACSPAYTLVVLQPALVSVDYDGHAVRMAWTPLPTTVTSIVSYTLSVFPTTGGVTQSVTIESARAASGVIPLTVPLTGAYSAQVLANTSYGVSSGTPKTNITTALPALLAAGYDGVTVSAGWMPPVTPILPVTSYLVLVSSPDGGSSFSTTALAGQTNANVTLPTPLTASKRYDLTIRAYAGTGISSSASTRLLVPLPRLKSVDWNGTTLAAAWEPVADPDPQTKEYRMVAYGVGGGALISQTIANPYANGGQFVSPAFTSGVPYMFSAYALTALAQAGSVPAGIFTAAPQIASVEFDGRQLTVRWNAFAAATQPAVAAFRVTAAAAGGQTFTKIVSDPFAVAATLDLTGVNASLPYAAQVSAIAVASVSTTAANSITATSAPAPLALSTPTLTSVTYDGARVLAAWEAPVGVTVTNYLIRVVARDGTTVQSTPLPPGDRTGSLAVGSPLSPTGGWTVSIVATTSGATVASPPLALLTELPLLETSAFDGANVLARWTPALTSDPAVSGYQLKAYSSQGGGTGITTVPNAAAREATVAIPGASTLAYVAQVCAYRGNVSGCSAALPLMQQTATLSGASYDGQNVTVQWAAVSGATAYAVAIVSGGATIVEQIVASATATTATLPAALDPAHAYAVSVRVTDAKGATGPAVTMPVISAVPGISNVVTSAANVVVTIDTSSTTGANGVSGYQASLYAGGRRVAGPIAAVTTANVTTATIPYATTAQTTYAASAQAVGATPASQAGPSSGATPVVSASPAFTSLDVTGTTATLAWQAVADPNVTGYLVTLTETGSNTATTHDTNGTTLAVTIDPNKSYTATVQALANAASGPAQAAAALTTASVGVSSALYDGGTLTVTWPAPGIAGASLIIVVTAGGSVVAQTPATGTSASIPIALARGGSYAAAVRVVSGAATGPTGAAMAIISAVPGVTQVVTGATQVVVTIDTSSTSGANGVSGYQASLYAGDRLVAGPTAAVTTAGVTTATIPYAVTPQTTYAVRVQAVGAVAATQAGPQGGAAPVISAAPSMIASGYDGANVTASWSGVTQPGVTGYAVTIADTTANTSQAPVFTVAQSISIATALQLTHAYTVSVQAIGDAATGPASSVSNAAANPLARSVGYFFPTAAVSQYAYLFRGDIRAPGASDITVYLPALFATPPAKVEVDPFTLTKVASPVDPSLPYTLTIPQNAAINVWAFTGNGIRTTLRTAYLAFLQEVEAPANGLLPGAMALLRQVIAQALPLTFAETLYYNYGLDALAGYVNLQPGMRLRVDFENRQFVSSDPGGTLSGFIGSGTSYYAISTLANGGAAPAVFDAFLAQMSLPNVSANIGGGAGVIDLQGSRFQQPYVRLFYPPTFPSSDSAGATGAAQNAVIAGAPTIAKLEEATSTYLRNRNFSGVTGIFWTYFRGRAVFVPEIACVAGGAPAYVPVGTTVRQLTEQIAPLPFGQAVTVQGFNYRRAIGNLVDQPAEVSASFAYARDNAVHFGFQPMTSSQYSGGLDAFDLPVLAGDVLVFGA
jgi:hypothetical protein